MKLKVLLVAIIIAVPLLGASPASAMLNPPEGVHKCYAVLSALGSRPVEVPCSPRPYEPPPPPAPEPPCDPPAPTPPVEATPAPPVVTPPTSPRKHRRHFARGRSIAR